MLLVGKALVKKCITISAQENEVQLGKKFSKVTSCRAVEICPRKLISMNSKVYLEFLCTYDNHEKLTL